MTNEEAIKILKVAVSEVEWNYPLDYVIAIETAVQALEKLMPKKAESTGAVIVSKGRIEKFYVCPNCQKFVFRHEHMYGNTDVCYCKWCGQALDWSDENE